MKSIGGTNEIHWGEPMKSIGGGPMKSIGGPMKSVGGTNEIHWGGQ